MRPQRQRPLYNLFRFAVAASMVYFACERFNRLQSEDMSEEDRDRCIKIATLEACAAVICLFPDQIGNTLSQILRQLEHQPALRL